MKRVFILVIASIAFGLLGWLAVSTFSEDETQQTTTLESSKTVPLGSNAVTNVDARLQTFTGEEFKNFYNDMTLPNTTPIVIPPSITGDVAADTRIQSLAEARGYRLRLVASSKLPKFESLELQALIQKDWQALRAEARKAGIELRITSAYRSVEEQRTLFVQQLEQRGISTVSIASGAADQQINSILATVSPPGYSRHHSGYTIDIADSSAAVFAYSKGYQWISANNFENAKKHGFIPSYPDKTTQQGPEPEPWEYVWVSREFISE